MVFDPSTVSDSQKLRLLLDSSQISADQTDFPLTVVLDGTDPFHAAVFADLGVNSKKLSIQSGTTQLPVEIEYWGARESQFVYADTDPIAHWTMGNISGSTLIDEKGNYDGTISNMAQTTGGKFDKYLAGGISDSLIRKVSFSSDVPFKTLSFWAKRGSTYTSDNTTFITDDDAHKGLGALVNTQGNTVFINDGVSSNLTNLSISDTNWHHIVLVEGSDNNHHFVWVDGVKSSSEVSSGFSGSFRNLGKGTTHAAYEVAGFDNVQVYDSVLTDDEIIELYNSQAGFAVLHTKVPTYDADADGELILSYDSSQPDNDGYVGEAGDTITDIFPEWTVGSSNAWTADLNFRFVIAAANLNTGKRFRIKFAGNTTNWNISSCYVGLIASSGDSYDFDGNQQQVTFGGNASKVVGSSDVYSDVVELDIDGTKDLVISLLSLSSTTRPYTGTLPTGLSSFYKSTSTDESAVTDATGYSSSISPRCLKGVLSVTPAQAVWDSNFAAVYHMAQDPSGGADCILDSTANANHGMPTGMVAGDLTDGLLGKALSFGSGKSINCGSDSSLNGIKTQEFLFYNLIGAYQGFGAIAMKYYSNTDRWGIFADDTAGVEAPTMAVNTGSTHVEMASDYGGLSAWHIGAFTNDGVDIQPYMDGVAEGSPATRNWATTLGDGGTLYLGAYRYNAGLYSMGGILDELRFSTIVRSADWIKLTHLSLTDQLITWSAYSAGGSTTFRVVHDLYYSNLLLRFVAVLDHYYHLLAGFRKEQAHVYGLRMCIEHALYYGSMPTFRRAFPRRYTNAPHLRKVFDRLYHDLARFTVEAERGYDIRGGLRLVQELSYMIAGAGFRLEQPHHYELMEYDRFRKAFSRLYAIAGAGSVTQKPVHTVRIGGALLAGVKVINVSALREQDVIVAEVQTASQGDALLAARWAEVEVRIGDDVYQLVVSRKPRRARTTEAADTWVITASSPAVLLDRDVLVREFEPGWASAIAAELAAPYGVSVSWEIVDWLVPADTLFATNESSLAVIDKLARAGGGIKQSAPDGTLRIIPSYPVSVNRWGTAEPEFIISDLYDLFSHDDEGDERSGYNSFAVSNLLSANQNAWLEYVDLTGERKEIRGYDVPRVDGRRFSVSTSGGPWVSVEPMGEVEEEIEEQVELFGGVGRLSKPCYGLLSVDWRQRQLGALSYSEDGTVQAEVAGASLALVRYTTRYWRWLARNARVEDVQFVREVEDEQPA